MRSVARFGLGVALATASPGAMAQTAEKAAAAFGARELVEQASLSPDGSKLAYVASSTGQGSALFIAALDGKGEPKPVFAVDGDPERLSSCRWSAQTRLICSLYGITQLPGGGIAYVSRQVAMDDDGKNVRLLINRGGSGEQLGYNFYGGDVIDWLPDQDGTVLMTREFVPQGSTGSILGASKQGLGVVQVDTRTLKERSVEPANANAAEYITDGLGNVRILGLVRTSGPAGYASGVTQYRYRAKGERGWTDLNSVDESGAGFNPYGIDPQENVAYGLKKLNGRLAAYKMSLTPSRTETLVFSHPEVDVDGFVRIGKRGRIVGVTYATDKRQAHYFDPQLQALSAFLAKAIPNSPLIRFVDSSADDLKLLLWAGGDVDPGRYYLFDRQTKRLAEILPARPQLAETALAPVKAVSYRAADGTAVPGYLTLPPGKKDAKGLPGIVMPHGGPGARDEWGFDWLAQFYANRGYAVLQPNFRGSAGYGDAWFQKNGFRNWRAAIGDVNDGGRWMVAEGLVDPKKLAVVGWSYGGYAALQSAATEPGLFHAAVAVAPVTDLEMLKTERRGWSDYALVSRFVGAGPHIEEGSPARNASRIKVPVLTFHGELDRNVAVAQSRRMAARLKAAGGQVELVTFGKLDHYLEDANARTELLGKSDAFLRQALGL